MGLLGIQILVICIFSLAACSAIYASYATCYTDPADDALVFKPYDNDNNRTNNGLKLNLATLPFCQGCISTGATTTTPTDGATTTNKDANKSYLPVETDVIYCYICEAHVHVSAKHCRYCDKCVGK